jgi:hypothetical protein
MSVKPNSWAKSAAQSSLPAFSKALGSAASAATARPMYSCDSLRSKRNCFFTASVGHMPEHPLGAHEPGIHFHYGDFRFPQFEAHIGDQAIQEFVAQVPQNLSAIGRGVRVQVVAAVSRQMPSLSSQNGLDHSAMVAPQAESTMRSRRPCSCSTWRNKAAASSSLPRSAHTGMPRPPRTLPRRYLPRCRECRPRVWVRGARCAPRHRR